MTFTEFVRQRETALLRLAMVLSGDVRQAEELVQAVLVRAFERWDRIGAVDDTNAYVRKMVVNEYLTLRRRWARLTTFDPTTHDGTVTDHSQTHAERDAVIRELSRLPRRQRAVLALRYYDGLSDAQIADALGCTVGTVRGYAARALATLRVEYRVAPQSRRPAVAE